MEKVNVIIIGAGVSGLVAARELARKNLTVRVLEAMDRVGGRLHSKMHTVPHTGQIIRYDVGGQWVGPSQRHVQELIREFGLELCYQYITGKSILFNKDAQTGELVKTRYEGILTPVDPRASDEMERALALCDELALTVPADNPWECPRAQEFDSMTCQTFIDRQFTSEEAKRVFTVLVRTVNACDPSEISFLFFLQYIRASGNIGQLIEIENGAQNAKIKGGAQQIPIRLAESVSKLSHCKGIHLSSPVSQVIDLQRSKNAHGQLRSQMGPMAVVTRDGRTFYGDFVIVSVPPTLSTRISYDPPMPAVRDCFCQHMPAGYVIKINLIFKSQWWRKMGLSGCVINIAEDLQYPVALTYDVTENVGLVGFMVGKTAVHWGKKTQDERLDIILKQYAKTFDVSEQFLRGELVFYEDKDWSQEEFIRGSYVSYTTPGGYTNYGEGLREPVGRIHFCGTETSDEWIGYMDGAIRSGKRVAAELIEKPLANSRL